ncbi:7556_t:CDS:2 [Gigaspora margarita]|uniref:7556_t:CDS:1 n=1 Tax=Gigaspora margarita TaxID=4874 RepID=A0ABN7UQB9_GIGMA|nr:7556_t:CDS:2 [Gigaspora margarita]
MFAHMIKHSNLNRNAIKEEQSVKKVFEIIIEKYRMEYFSLPTNFKACFDQHQYLSER